MLLAIGLNVYVLLPDPQEPARLEPADPEEKSGSARVPTPHSPAVPSENTVEPDRPNVANTHVGAAKPTPGHEILTENPYQVLAEKAKAYLDAGDTFRFISTLRELRDQFPDDAAANRELGRAYVRQGEDRNALYYLEKALALERENPETLQALSLAYYRTEDLEKARDLTRQFLAQSPDDAAMQAFLEKIEREHTAQSGFIAERSDHFDLFYDNFEFRHLGRPILRLLDDAYRKVGTELGIYPDRPVSVILYSNRSFREVTLGPDWTGGIYDGKIRLPVRDMDPDDPRLASVLTHEFVHAVVHSVSARCPTWLNEGLATYLEGRTLPNIRIRANLRHFEPSFMSLDSNQARVAYTVSLSAVSFLVREFGMYRIRGILLQVDKATTFQEAFDGEMPLGYDEFIRRWNEA